MSNERIGWGGADELKPRMNSPSVKSNANGYELTERFSINYDDAWTAIVARGYDFGDYYPDAPYTGTQLKEIGITKSGPQNAIVSYVWRTPDSGDSDLPVGTITREADSNAIDIPIGQHPNASPGNNYDEENKIGKGDWEGIESYIDPQPQYIRKEVLDSFTFSEANIIHNVGKIHTGAQMNTAGMSAATDGKWLKMSLRIGESGDNYDKSEMWQYAENGWRTDIYDPASGS